MQPKRERNCEYRNTSLTVLEAPGDMNPETPGTKYVGTALTQIRIHENQSSTCRASWYFVTTDSQAQNPRIHWATPRTGLVTFAHSPEERPEHAQNLKIGEKEEEKEEGNT